MGFPDWQHFMQVVAQSCWENGLCPRPPNRGTLALCSPGRCPACLSLRAPVCALALKPTAATSPGARLGSGGHCGAALRPRAASGTPAQTPVISTPTRCVRGPRCVSYSDASEAGQSHHPAPPPGEESTHTLAGRFSRFSVSTSAPSMLIRDGNVELLFTSRFLTAEHHSTSRMHRQKAGPSPSRPDVHFVQRISLTRRGSKKLDLHLQMSLP